MSISASASFELRGCSYHNLDDHRKEKLHTRIVVLGDHERRPDPIAKLSLEHPANTCPLLKVIIIVGLICLLAQLNSPRIPKVMIKNYSAIY